MKSIIKRKKKPCKNGNAKCHKIIINTTPGSSRTSSCVQLLLQRNSTRNMYFLQQRVFLYSSYVELTHKPSVLRRMRVCARELSDTIATFCCPWCSCFQIVKATVNVMPDKYLFHNAITQFLLFNGQNDFVIKWKKI